MPIEAGSYRYTMALVLVILTLVFLGLLLLTTLLALRGNANYASNKKINTMQNLPSPIPLHARVQADYLRAIAWLSKGIVLDVATQRAEAPAYLCGDYLAKHRTSLQQNSAKPALIGVLRCIHTLNIQPIEEDEARCLVIDSQFTRRMVTYCTKTYQRVTTQDLGNCAVVYEMCYDSHSQRWKLSRFIQELPHGWNGVHSAYPIQLVKAFTPEHGKHI